MHFTFLFFRIMDNISPFLGTLLWNIVVAFWIIAVVLVVRFIKNKLISYLDYITALTVWLLMWIIFLGFLPTLIWSGLEGGSIWLFMLIWVFFFYLLELFLHWHHCKDLDHSSSCTAHDHHREHKNGILMFGWTIMHNAFHGIVLFSAFAVDFHFWVATTLAILLHSIPQNVVNYIMNHNNAKYAYFAAFGGILGALITYPFADFLVANKFYILALIAGWLLYTALADIFPEFKGKWTTLKKFSYLVFILIGIFAFLGFEKISEWAHDHNHESGEIHEHTDEHHDEESLEEICEEHDWVYLEGYEFNECGGISKEICEEIWWNFNECASACRNNPEAEICTMQCVAVCEFEKN